MAEQVRVGVVGAGMMGLRHCQTLALHVPEAELAAVADIDEDAARRGAAGTQGAVATADYQALLADPSIRAVIIASPNVTHAQIIQEAAQAGKQIFCEKPIAVDLASADAALAAANRHGVKLQIGFQRRFDPAFAKAKRAIDAGELGAVELIVATTRDPAPPSLEKLRGSGGLFPDTAIHDLDSVRFLSGLEVSEVYATASTLFLPGDAGEKFVDTAIISLRLETGALAVITNSLRAAYGYEVSIEVMGEGGKVAIGQEQETGLRSYTAQGVWHDYVNWFLNRFQQAFVREMIAFVECVAHDRRPEVSGEDGRTALKLALLAARSFRERRPLSVDEDV